MASTTPTDTTTKQRGLRLNIGCGPIQPEGWVNIDSSMRAKLASRANWLDNLLVAMRILPPTEFNRSTVIQDVSRPMRFADNSVDAIYCGEILEHFTKDVGQQFLHECFRILAPGGVLRIRVPDNYIFWKKYTQQYEAVLAKPREEWNEDHERWTTMFFRDICTRRLLLSSIGHYHKWMYDEITLILAFERAGFVDVQRKRMHDSLIGDIAAVEVRENLIVEGVKPG